MTLRVFLEKEVGTVPELIMAGAKVRYKHKTMDLKPGAVVLDRVQELLEDGWHCIGMEVIDDDS